MSIKVCLCAYVCMCVWGGVLCPALKVGKNGEPSEQSVHPRQKVNALSWKCCGIPREQLHISPFAETTQSLYLQGAAE